MAERGWYGQTYASMLNGAINDLPNLVDFAKELLADNCTKFEELAEATATISNAMLLLVSNVQPSRNPINPQQVYALQYIVSSARAEVEMCKAGGLNVSTVLSALTGLSNVIGSLGFASALPEAFANTTTLTVDDTTVKYTVPDQQGMESV